jgi:hypothetical protein
VCVCYSFACTYRWASRLRVAVYPCPLLMLLVTVFKCSAAKRKRAHPHTHPHIILHVIPKLLCVPIHALSLPMLAIGCRSQRYDHIHKQYAASEFIRSADWPHCHFCTHPRPITPQQAAHRQGRFLNTYSRVGFRSFQGLAVCRPEPATTCLTSCFPGTLHTLPCRTETLNTHTGAHSTCRTHTSGPIHPHQGFAGPAVFRHHPAPHPGSHTPRASLPHRNTHGCAHSTCRTRASRLPEPATTLLDLLLHSCHTARPSLSHRDMQPHSTSLAVRTFPVGPKSHPSSPRPCRPANAGLYRCLSEEQGQLTPACRCPSIHALAGSTATHHPA